MKHSWKIFKRYAFWLLLLFCIDGFAAILLWIADIQAFHAVLAVIILATILMFAISFGAVCYHDTKKEQAFRCFLHNTDEYNEEVLLKLCSDAEREMVQLLGEVLRERENETKRLMTQVSDYEEYVETWAHETKTPLSLLTLLLDNRREEVPENIVFKLDFVRNRMQESINQMLFYARLKGAKKDYLFEYIDLKICVGDVLADYRPLLDEKQFILTLKIPEISVYSDKRGLGFLISQLISNSIKYNQKNELSKIDITAVLNDNHYILFISDNGIGVHSCDLPYIFEKGFTGVSEDGRRKATGMGLYLAKAIANDLNISLEAESEWGKGFEMKVTFPIIDTF